jgi:hypothetical protein
MNLKKALCQIACIASIVTIFTANPINKVFAAQTTNRAYSTKYFDNWWWHYDGVAQFNPSYKIPKDPGYSLDTGKYVKQSYVNYTRKKTKIKGLHITREDVSVIGGRSYSPVASSKKTNATYKATATAKDSLNIIGNQTKFWYGWIYF